MPNGACCATADDDIPQTLRSELDRLLGALSNDLQVPVPAVRALKGATAAGLREGVLVVPAQFVAHWNRFGVLPSALVRDVAYTMKRRQLAAHGGLSGATIEADSMAYAERFLRAATDFEDDEASED